MGNDITKKMTVGHVAPEIKALMKDPSCKKIPLAPSNKFQRIFYTKCTPEEKIRSFEDYLNENAELIHSLEMNGFPAIFMAVRSTPSILRVFLEKGADPNATHGGWTPLDFACAENNLEIVKALVDAGAELNTDNPPVIQSVYRNNLRLLEYLYELGADLHKTDEQGWSLLHYAAQYNHVDICLYLLQQGMQVDVKEKDGWTPLHLAAYNGKMEAAKVLVEKNANVNELDFNERSVLYKAIACNHLEMITWLLGQSADPNVGKSTLHKAISKNNTKVVSMLIENNINVKRVDKKDRSPIQLAREHKNHEIIALLTPQAELVTKDLLNVYLTQAINATATMVLQQVNKEIQSLEKRIEKLENTQS